jgi:hypothetical protein
MEQPERKHDGGGLEDRSAVAQQGDWCCVVVGADDTTPSRTRVTTSTTPVKATAARLLRSTTSSCESVSTING